MRDEIIICYDGTVVIVTLGETTRETLLCRHDAMEEESRARTVGDEQ